MSPGSHHLEVIRIRHEAGVPQIGGTIRPKRPDPGKMSCSASQGMLFWPKPASRAFTIALARV